MASDEDSHDDQGNPRKLGRSGRFRKTPEERRIAKAARREREAQGTTASLILFSIHLGRGLTPFEALKAAELWNQQGKDEEQRAQQLSETVRVQTLMQAMRMDPKLILQANLSAVALAEIDLAFNAKNELVRLKAIQDILSRGGLPAESVTFHGTGKDLQQASSEDLLQRVKKIYETLQQVARDDAAASPKKIDA